MSSTPALTSRNLTLSAIASFFAAAVIFSLFVLAAVAGAERKLVT
jgi:hypothetical protein